MNSIGETLRRERLRRNLDLDQIARETKISSRLLQAIEAEDFNKLPGGVFTRSFVRQYARALGLDEEEITAELQQTLQPPANQPETAIPALEEPPIDLPRVPDWGSARAPRTGSLLPALALVVVVMLLCSGIYAWWQRNRGRPAYVAQIPAVQQSAPVHSGEPPAAPANTPIPLSPAPEQVPPAADRQAPAGIVSGSGNPAAAIHVLLTAEEPTWVSARSDGKIVYSGTLQANEKKDLEGLSNMRLVVGNAGGLSITLNGKPVPPLGPKGQVRIVQLSPGGVQIVPPKPPAPDNL